MEFYSVLYFGYIVIVAYFYYFRLQDLENEKHLHTSEEILANGKMIMDVVKTWAEKMKIFIDLIPTQDDSIGILGKVL